MGIRPELTSRECCIKNPELKVKTFFLKNAYFRENAYLSRKFQAIFLRKTLYSAGPHLSAVILITPVS